LQTKGVGARRLRERILESVAGDGTRAHGHWQMGNTDDLGFVDEPTAAVEKLRLLTEHGAVNFFCLIRLMSRWLLLVRALQLSGEKNRLGRGPN